MKHSTLAAGLLALLAPAAPAQFGFGDAPAGPTMNRPIVRAETSRFGFRTGFNQAWLGRDYGHHWGARYDRAEVEAVCARTAELRGTIVRMWLLESLNPDGVLWDGASTPGPAPTDRHRGRPTGYSARHLANLEHFLQTAAGHGVQVYLTLFTGNIYSSTAQAGYAHRKAEWWNMLHDRYGVDAAWRQNVLRPILEVLVRHRRAVYAIDLMNEGNALVERPSSPWLEDGWTSYAAWVRRWHADVGAASDIPLGVSFGHHMAIDNFLDQRLPEDAIDFYDVHAYNDTGEISQAGRVRARIRELATRGIPVFLGEFGQGTERYRDALQAEVTEGFLRNAASMGFAAALAWRLQDIRDTPDASWLSFVDGEVDDPTTWTWRPAAEVFRTQSLGLVRLP